MAGGPDFRLRYLLDRLAEIRGDVDGRVAAIAEDLRNPGQYLRIAEILAEAGRTAEAVDWAGRHADLLDLRRDHFENHPADALPVFRTEMDHRIAGMNRGSYQLAARWLARIRDLHARLGTSEEAANLVAEIRAQHRRKRNLMAALDAQGL